MSQEWNKLKPDGADDPSTIDDSIQTNNEALDRLITNYRQGCKLRWLTNSTIEVAAGELTLSNSAGTVRRLRKNTSAITVGWVDLDTGSEAASTLYYVYGVADTDAETFTVKLSTSSSAPTGATYYRKIGSVYNNSDSNMERVDSLDGYTDKIDNTVAADFTLSSLTTDASWRDLGTKSIVPDGAKLVHLHVKILDDAVNSKLFFRRNGNTTARNLASGLGTQVANVEERGDLWIPCDEEGEIEYWATSTTWTSIEINIVGWLY